MDFGTAIAVGSAALSISLAFIAFLRDGRRDQVAFLEGKVTEMETAHLECQRELSSLRHELAWMRQNMVMQPGARPFAAP
jgi:hypothetical protein